MVYHLLKQLGNQLATSVLTTCNRLVVNKLPQAMQMVLLSSDNKSVARCQLSHFFQNIILRVLGRTGTVVLDRTGTVVLDRTGTVVLDRTGTVVLDRTGTVVLGSCAFSVVEGELQSVE